MSKKPANGAALLALAAVTAACPDVEPGALSMFLETALKACGGKHLVLLQEKGDDHVILGQAGVNKETLSALHVAVVGRLKDVEGRRIVRVKQKEKSASRILLVSDDELDLETLRALATIVGQILYVRSETLEDSVTRLLNRKSLELHISSLEDEARRHLRPVGVLFVDIDRFKQVNDAHGHSAGDSVLRQVAECLAKLRRPGDILGRYGGEELVWLGEVDSPEKLAVIAERFRTAVETLQLRKNGTYFPFKVTISVGGTIFKSAGRFDPRTIANAIERADKAMYRAKKDGRNRVVIEA